MTAKQLQRIIYELRSGRQTLYKIDVPTSFFTGSVKRQIESRMAREGMNLTEAVRATVLAAGYQPKLKKGVTQSDVEKALERFNKKLETATQKGVIPDTSLLYKVNKQAVKNPAKVLASLTGGPTRVYHVRATTVKNNLLESANKMKDVLKGEDLTPLLADVLESKIKAMSDTAFATALKSLGGKPFVVTFYSSALKLNLQDIYTSFNIKRKDLEDVGATDDEIRRLRL